MVARTQELVVRARRAGRRPREHHIPRFERDVAANRRKLFSNRKQHVGGRAILALLAVDPQPKTKIAGVGHEARGREVVKRTECEGVEIIRIALGQRGPRAVEGFEP